MDRIAAANHSSADLGESPILGNSPCGNNVRYETSFDQLESEIAKDESVSSDSTDWNTAKNLAEKILRNESKDLLVAAYYTQALLKTENYLGLATGLQICADLIDHHWQELFPPLKRLRARASALEWLAEKSASTVEAIAPSPDEAGYVFACDSALSRIVALCADKMEDSEPSMSELTRALREQKRVASEHYSPQSSADSEVGDAGNSLQNGISTEAKTNDEAQQTDHQAANKLHSPIESAPDSDVEGDSADFEHPLVSLGNTPITSEDPTGISVKYEPDFEAMEAELAKQESVSAASTDWPTVGRLGEAILRSQSKDILVASYFTKALFETEGYKGLALGMRILTDMVNLFWDDLHPPLKRIRARNAAIEWLGEKLGESIGAQAPRPEDAQYVVFADAFANELVDALDKHYESNAPSLFEITKPLKDYKRAAAELLKPKADPVCAPKVPANTAQDKPSAVGADEHNGKVPPVRQTQPNAPPPKPPPLKSEISEQKLESENDIKKALRQIQDAQRKIASHLHNGSTNDPRVFRLNRISCWLMIETPPPANENQTQLQPPSADKRKQLQSLIEAEKHKEVLAQAEPILARAPFWFDGQRIVAQALDALGTDYQNARQIVVSELRNFLSRVPGLLDLQFANGEPFADDQTRLWLNNDVLASNSEPADTTDCSATINETLNKAKALFTSNKAKDAYSLIDEAMNRSTSQKDTFQWRLALADLQRQMGNLETSASLLTSLVQEIKDSQLTQWDPALCATVFHRQYDCYSALSKKHKDNLEYRNAVETALVNLCRASPVRAIEIKENSNG